ncbi:thioesterase domain-containing protein [Streptomyces sp. YS415]|uniref:thioesterase II family protein n=1 Tax=Streptomyces sp. YS415 TaxID=2944806 RepID=UPI0020204300|nr:thioesterase domain-containing protein [Streptomyces sp. YS415]MCL7428469.1 thioesterase domain-containing protein [Streptomyces sp. YS415]
MTAAAAVSWLGRAPRADARLRLFCFHHAGGGASFFRSWADRVPSGVEVLPVQLPGREARYRERRFQDAGELVEALGRDLAPWLDEGPWAAYGHSMGALVAVGLAAARLRENGRGPEAVFLGAYAAPHLTPVLPPPDRYDDRELARLLVDFGGMDARFLEREDWLRVLLPIVRDDLRICASHAGAGLPDPDDERARLPLAVEAFAGLDDPLVEPGRVRAWERYAHDFRLTLVPGGHFFPREEPGPFFARLNRSLGRLLGEPAPAGPLAAPG